MLDGLGLLHEEAIKIEKLVTRPRGGGSTSTPPQRARRNQTIHTPRPSPRYHLPAVYQLPTEPAGERRW